MATHNNAVTIYRARGKLEQMQGLLCPINANYECAPSNFVISGGANSIDRYAPLPGVLTSVMGRIPVIILHGRDDYLEEIVAQTWNQDPDVTLWQANVHAPCFEPFYGMTARSIINVLRKLAPQLEYTASPQLDRIVKAHLKILDLLEIPYSLSGLEYLCQFSDMSEFHDNILQLPCSEAEAMRIWADLDTDDEARNGQFDLFRSLINALADEAANSGWQYDDEIANANTMMARRENAVFMLSVDPAKNELLMTYLMQELKESREGSFFLLIDDLNISSDMAQYLYSIMPSNYVCILSANVVGNFENQQEDFPRVAERMDYLVFFKHNSARTATAISELIGKEDVVKTEHNKGYHRGVFDFLPKGVNMGETIRTDNEFRVMPEQIQNLAPEQAVIFDMRTNDITLYNCGRRF